jgi:conjugative transfer signal peptidase TraF
MNRVVGVAGWGVFIVIVTIHVAVLAGLRVNLSPSVPRGLYWLQSDAPRVGDYVAICPPRSQLFDRALKHGYVMRGTCPSGYGELIKVLAAADDADVAVSHDGVAIAGALWPLSVPKQADALGRRIPQRVLPWHAVLSASTVLVMSDRNAFGFDSRYFGPLERAAIVGGAHLIFAF